MEQEFVLQQVLERYDVDNVRLTHHLSDLNTLSLDNNFVLALLRLFEEDTIAQREDFADFSLHTILDYIQRTHRYYLSKKLPEIEQSIELMLRDYSDNHPLLTVLRQFYASYKADLTKHIQTEERFVLPHIRLIATATEKGYNAEKFQSLTKNYSLRAFVEGHTDTEGDLQKVRDTILEYTPPSTNTTLYRVLLTQLELFEKDLSVHAIIEDEVLIPFAIAMEDALLTK